MSHIFNYVVRGIVGKSTWFTIENGNYDQENF